jgi:hypothetical protein
MFTRLRSNLLSPNSFRPQPVPIPWLIHSGLRTAALEFTRICQASSVNQLRHSPSCRRAPMTLVFTKLLPGEVSPQAILLSKTNWSSASMFRMDVLSTKSPPPERQLAVSIISCAKMVCYLGHPRGAQQCQGARLHLKLGVSLMVLSKHWPPWRRQRLLTPLLMVVLPYSQQI